MKESPLAHEIFDVVDGDDRVIGTATRAQVHGDPELIHRVIHILVFNHKNDLYLQKRSAAKDTHPGKWDTSVGGHVDKGESYYDAAVRELEEELGIRGARLNFLYKYQCRNEIESEYVSSFYCRWDGEIQINLEEIEKGAFWSLPDIEAKADTGIFTPNLLEEMARYKRYLNAP